MVKKRIKPVKKGILDLVFSRVFVLAVLVIIQLVVFGATVTFIQEYANYIHAIFLVLSVVVVIYIINRDGNASFKITWMLLILITPILGTAFYGYMKLELGTTFLKKRLQHLNKSTKPYLLQDKEVLEELRVSKAANANLASYMTNSIAYPTYRNTSVRYFSSGEEKFEELKKQLKQAEEYIFMEYFIVEKGQMWSEILDILKEKVWQGVEVRFMYDGMCSLYLLPTHYDAELRRAGIKCKQFNPVRPILTSYQNNRDHRKICVIDGKVAFTGGINLADEYINVKERFGHWKDTAIMLEGEAVQSFTMMFLEMWNITEKREDSYERYLTPKSDEIKRELGFVTPYADSPFDEQNVGEQVYLHILNHAKKYVHIMTPYLIVDEDLLMALQYVAQCGVEVIIIMPHIPDKWYAFTVAKTYYETLMRSGVQIYEYTPGFVHAKVFVSDNDTATVGTINLDYRSLYLHFENGVLLYGCSAVEDMKEDYDEILRKCSEVTNDYQKRPSLIVVIKRSILRLFAPLL